MEEREKLNGLWIGKTGKSNAWYHIYPFVNSPKTNKLFVVRYERPQRDIVSDKVDFRTFDIGKGNASHLFKLFSKGFKTLRKEKIDYVVSFSLVPWGTVGWILAKLFRKKVIIGLIGSDFNVHVEKDKLSFLFKYILKKSDVITTTGSVMSAAVEKIVGDKTIEVFPHCLPDELFYDRPAKASHKIRLISISGLTSNKRTIDIVQAVEILAKKGLDTELTVLGEGAEWNNLEEYIANNNLSDKVFLKGYVNDIRSYTEKADVFVQASLKEGLSLSLVESLGMELIPVITEAGSEKDIVTDKVNGLFFERKNPQDLADKIEVLYKEENYLSYLNEVKKLKDKLSVNHATKMVEDIQLHLNRKTNE